MSEEDRSSAPWDAWKHAEERVKQLAASCARKDAALRKILALHRSTQIGEGYSWQNENVCVECDGESWPCQTHKLARAALAEAAPAAGETERIIHAAVLTTGRNHAECLGNRGSSHRAQGFVTSTGRFVDRVEALKIAAAAGQLAGRVKYHPIDRLLSEDLWDVTAPPAAPEPEPARERDWRPRFDSQETRIHELAFQVAKVKAILDEPLQDPRDFSKTGNCWTKPSLEIVTAWRNGAEALRQKIWAFLRDPAPEPQRKPPTLDAFLRSCAEDCVNARHEAAASTRLDGETQCCDEPAEPQREEE